MIYIEDTLPPGSGSISKISSVTKSYDISYHIISLYFKNGFSVSSRTKYTFAISKSPDLYNH